MVRLIVIGISIIYPSIIYFLEEIKKMVMNSFGEIGNIFAGNTMRPFCRSVLIGM